MSQVRLHYWGIWLWAAQFVAAAVGLIVAAMNHFDPTTFFLLSVGYISLCSIYANLVGHWGAWEAAKAKQAADKNTDQ